MNRSRRSRTTASLAIAGLGLVGSVLAIGRASPVSAVLAGPMPGAATRATVETTGVQPVLPALAAPSNQEPSRHLVPLDFDVLARVSVTLLDGHTDQPLVGGNVFLEVPDWSIRVRATGPLPKGRGFDHFQARTNDAGTAVIAITQRTLIDLRKRGSRYALGSDARRLFSNALDVHVRDLGEFITDRPFGVMLEGPDSHHTIRLHRGVELEIAVEDADTEAPISGAKVFWVEHDDRVQRYGTSDVEGRVLNHCGESLLRKRGPGERSYYVVAKGYAIQSGSVSIPDYVGNDELRVPLERDNGTLVRLRNAISGEPLESPRRPYVSITLGRGGARRGPLVNELVKMAEDGSLLLPYLSGEAESLHVGVGLQGYNSVVLRASEFRSATNDGGAFWVDVVPQKIGLQLNPRAYRDFLLAPESKERRWGGQQERLVLEIEFVRRDSVDDEGAETVNRTMRLGAGGLLLGPGKRNGNALDLEITRVHVESQRREERDCRLYVPVDGGLAPLGIADLNRYLADAIAAQERHPLSLYVL